MAAVLASSRAHADETEYGKFAASRAAALFEEGRALGKAGNWTKACDRFAESLELIPAVGTQLNLADCLEREGYLHRAWVLFESAATESERAGTDVRTKFARERADALEQRLAVLVVKLADPDTAGLEVKVGGRDVKPAAKIREVVTPGAVEVIAKAPGVARFSRTIRVRRGDKLSVDVPAMGSELRRRRSWVIAAGVFGAAGATSLLYGVYQSVQSASYQSSAAGCPGLASECDDLFRAGIASDRAAQANIAGIVLLGSSLILFAVAPKDAVKRVAVVPTASARAAGIGISGTF